MQPDDEICYCYHVSLRKLVNFARRVRPVQPSRMTECLGAGTGCGWCIPFLTKIAKDPDRFDLGEITPEQYADSRKSYIKTQPRNTFDESMEAQKQVGMKSDIGNQAAKPSSGDVVKEMGEENGRKSD